METNQSKQSRRQFLKNAGILGAMVLAVGMFIRNMILYLFPKTGKAATHKYLVAHINEVPRGKAKQITIAEKPVFVVNGDQGYKVFSGVCTHLGCIVRWEEQKGHFYCPCHQGIFNKDGQVTSGPPPRPLDEFTVEVENQLVFIRIETKTEGPWT